MKNTIETFTKLISEEVNNPKLYEKLAPLPVVVLGKAAIKAKFPELDVSKLNIAKLVKEEILNKNKPEDLIPQWYKDKWLKKTDR